jgi:hypothetical protein
MRFDPRAYVFRLSVYRSTMRPQDIVIPTETEDLGAKGISLRPKTALPTVSFCGMAGLPTFRSRLRFIAQNILYDLRSLGNPSYVFRKRGIYWRQKAIQACKNSSAIITSFIVRKSFSGHARTISLNPLRARQEFIENLRDSDFALTPKGDGNYSNRFLEALSLGRVPVLIDTDTVLPLESVIKYEKCVVRIPAALLRGTPRLVRAFYDGHSEEAWNESQRYAREVYERYLRFDRFFLFFFTEVIKQLPPQPSGSKMIEK